MKQPDWNPRELRLLNKHYPTTNNDDLSILIGTRTANAIAKKAGKLGIPKSESFLNSPLSGRFQAPKTPALSWISKFFKNYRLKRFRKNVKEGKLVNVRIADGVKKDLRIYTISGDRVTCFNPQHNCYQAFPLSEIFPPVSKIFN